MCGVLGSGTIFRWLGCCVDLKVGVFLSFFFFLILSRIDEFSSEDGSRRVCGKVCIYLNRGISPFRLPTLHGGGWNGVSFLRAGAQKEKKKRFPNLGGDRF